MGDSNLFEFPSDESKHPSENSKSSYSKFDDRNSFPRKRQNAPPNSVIGVFGLSDDTTELDLKNAFSPYGEIKKINLIYDRKTGKFKCFAFIYFETVEEASNALNERNETEINGNVIRIDFSATAYTPYSRRLYSDDRGGSDAYPRRRDLSSDYDYPPSSRHSYDYYDRRPAQRNESYSRTSSRRYESPERSSERFNSHASRNYPSPPRRFDPPFRYSDNDHRMKSQYEGDHHKGGYSPTPNDRPYSRYDNDPQYRTRSPRHTSRDYTRSPSYSSEESTKRYYKAN